MENTVVDTPTNTVETTSDNQVELLIDDAGIMDEETPSQPDTKPSEEDSNDDTPTSEQDNNDESDKPTTTDEELKYDLDEPSDKDYVIKVNGELIKTSLQELKVLAQKGMSYSQKTMDLAKHKDLLNSLEQYGITSIDELNNFMAQGNTEIEEVKSQYSNDVEQVAETIMEQSNAMQFKEVLHTLPQEFIELAGKDAKILGQAYNSFNDGTLAKLAPEARKMMALRPTLSFMDAIQLAGDKIYGKPNNKAKTIQEPRNSFESKHSDVLTDKEFQELSAKLSTLN